MIDSHNPVSTTVSCDRCGKLETLHHERKRPTLADNPRPDDVILSPPISLDAFRRLGWGFNFDNQPSWCPDCDNGPAASAAESFHNLARAVRGEMVMTGPMHGVAK